MESIGRLVSAGAGMTFGHPVPAEEAPSQDYRVAVNGRPVITHPARVSAYPLNQIWPGYQRPIEQTELATFASWDMDGPAEVVIESARPVKSVRILPASSGVRAEAQGDTIRLTVARPGQFTVQVDGPHRVLHLFANAPERDIPDANDPQIRYFGPGVHSPGQIRLTSGQTVYLAEGAVVYGCLLAEDAEDIAVRGRGILDCSQIDRAGPAGTVQDRRDRAEVTHGPLVFVRCRRVVVEGIVVRDSNCWTAVAVACEDVWLRNLKLIGHWRYNADGVDFVNSRQCRLEDSFIRAFDDCVCFKGRNVSHGHTGNREPVGDIEVRRCVLWNDWGVAVKIGTETVASEIAGILIEDCDIIQATDTVFGIHNSDGADCHDIEFRDIRVELDNDPMRPVFQQRKDQVYEVPADDTYVPSLVHLLIFKGMYSTDAERGQIHDIRFKNIAVTSRAMPPSRFVGLDADHTIRDVTFERLRVNGRLVDNGEDAGFQRNEFAHGVKRVSSAPASASLPPGEITDIARRFRQWTVRGCILGGLAHENGTVHPGNGLNWGRQ